MNSADFRSSILRLSIEKSALICGLGEINSTKPLTLILWQKQIQSIQKNLAEL